MSRRFVFFIAGLLALLAASGCSFSIQEDALHVVRYTGPALTPADSRNGWTVRIEGTEVTLQALPEEGDPNRLTLFLTLEDVPRELPVLKDVWEGPYGGGIGVRVGVASLEVERWDPPDRISGVISYQARGVRTRRVVWFQAEAPDIRD